MENTTMSSLLVSHLIGDSESLSLAADVILGATGAGEYCSPDIQPIACDFDSDFESDENEMDETTIDESDESERPKLTFDAIGSKYVAVCRSCDRTHTSDTFHGAVTRCVYCKRLAVVTIETVYESSLDGIARYQLKLEEWREQLKAKQQQTVEQKLLARMQQLGFSKADREQILSSLRK